MSQSSMFSSGAGMQLRRSKRKAPLMATNNFKAKDQGDKRARLQAMPRTNVTTPQVMVILAAQFDPILKQMRDQAIDNTGELICPPAADQSEFYIRQGDILMCSKGSGEGIRTTPGSGPPIVAFNSPAGLSERDLDDLFFPAMAAANQHEPNQQVAMKVHGIDTQTNYDSARIYAGDMLIVDPVPNLVADKSGALVPAVYGPKGSNQETKRFRLRGHNPMRQQEYEMQHFAESMLRMADQKFKDELKKCVTGDDVHEVIAAHCNHIFTDLYHASEQDPIRFLLEMWTAEKLLCLLRCGGMVGARELGQPALKALLITMQETQEQYQNRADAWRDELPHEITADPDCMGAEAMGYGLTSDIYKNLMADRPLGPEEYMKVDAHLRMSFNHYFRLQSHRLNNWLQQFTFGLALSCAEKGNNYDCFIGKKQ